MYRLTGIDYDLAREGFHVGEPFVNVRFAGCNRHCAHCDYGCEQKRVVGLDELIHEVGEVVGRTGCNRVRLTGGEPAMQVTDTVVEALRSDAYARIHIETNGSLPLKGKFDWVAVTPGGGEGLAAVVSRVGVKVDECRVVVAGPSFVPPAIAKGIYNCVLVSMRIGGKIDPESDMRARQIAMWNRGWRYIPPMGEVKDEERRHARPFAKLHSQ